MELTVHYVWYLRNISFRNIIQQDHSAIIVTEKEEKSINIFATSFKS